MRILFVCSTEFQLLNALNIKYHMFSDCDADIVLQRPNFKEFVERLKLVNMYGCICYAKPELLGLHQYFRDITNKGISHVSLSKAIINTIIIAIKKIKGLFGGPKKTLDNLLFGYQNIKDIKYDKVFMQSGNEIVRNFYKDLHNIAEMVILDEGVGSYYLDTICHKNTKADSAYVYDPDVVVYGGVDLVKIPALSNANEEFINIANKVFDYKKSHIRIRNKTIFFDEGGEIMPAYLKNAGWLKKIVFSNSIKKHMQSHLEYMKQVYAFKKIASNNEVYIKYHPRTPNDMLQEYDEKIFHEIEQRRIPWELYLCNNDIEHCNFITMSSSSVSLYPLIIGGDNDCILLYKCFGFPISHKCEQFLKKVAIKYNKSCFIIENECELLDKISTFS